MAGCNSLLWLICYVLCTVECSVWWPLLFLLLLLLLWHHLGSISLFFEGGPYAPLSLHHGAPRRRRRRWRSQQWRQREPAAAPAAQLLPTTTISSRWREEGELAGCWKDTATSVYMAAAGEKEEEGHHAAEAQYIPLLLQSMQGVE